MEVKAAMVDPLPVEKVKVPMGHHTSPQHQCVATYSGRLPVARVFIGQQQQQQCNSAKLLS